MINVVAASSISILREGIKAICDPHKDITVFAEASYMQEVLSGEHDGRNRVIVIAAPLYYGPDKELLPTICEKVTRRVIVIALGETDEEVYSALKIGARGILSRTCPPQSLVEAVRKVGAGKMYVSQEMAMLIATRLKPAPVIELLSRLTQREMEILKMVAIGRRASTIGAALGISVKTVSTHKTNIFAKLLLTSDSELVLYAIRNNLFDLFVDHSRRTRRQA